MSILFSIVIWIILSIILGPVLGAIISHFDNDPLGRRGKRDITTLLVD